MGNLSFLTRAEIESLGPPTPEELEELEVSDAFLRDLALKHVATIADPTTASVADKLRLPLALTDELLYQLYREKLIEWYGKDRGEKVNFAEAFEICEYGKRPSRKELEQLFPFFGK